MKLICWVMIIGLGLGLGSDTPPGGLGSDMPPDLVFLILNEDHPHHINEARNIRDEIQMSAMQYNTINIKTYITSLDFPDNANWIYIPLMSRLNELYGKQNNCWFVLIEETTEVNLTQVLHLVSGKSSKEKWFLGRGLHDQDSTIIHHFDPVNVRAPFLYPDPRTGFILSVGLLRRLYNDGGISNYTKQIDFSIDPVYEFSKVILSVNVSLTTSPSFCLHKEDQPHPCAFIHKPRQVCLPADPHDVHFSIKTCEKFHDERLPILHSTWLPLALKYTLFSDAQDIKYGTVKTGVKNTLLGHCSKTLHIIDVAAASSSISWLVIVDDDTLISVPKLLAFLGCYDPSDDIAVGQRYGYSLLHKYGYDYLTGGAGMVFSIALVRKLAQSGVCECPSDDTPDDMYLGLCLRRLQVPIIHSHLFHQARPNDYAEELLEDSSPISFHKFWMIDPVKQYNKWLNTSQVILNRRKNIHQEL